MKGPGLKGALDTRRLWECPACGRQVRRQGDVVASKCGCREQPMWMHLVEARRANRPYQPYIVPETPVDDSEWDDEPQTPPESPPQIEAVEIEVVESQVVEVEVLENQAFADFSPEPAVEIPPLDVEPVFVVAPPELLEESAVQAEPASPTAPPSPSAEPPAGEGRRKSRSRRRRGARRRSDGSAPGERGASAT